MIRILLISLGVAIGVSGCVTAPWPPKVSDAQAEQAAKVQTGPFWWGVSTSGYQTEDKGYSPDDPRYFKTDWDLYIERGDAPARGEGTYSYSEFDADLQLLKSIGVNHYRFGVEWARVEPQPGVYNQEAIDHYVNMARKIRAAGIEPVACLWHFTFPDWLTDFDHPGRSHWLHPDSAQSWRDYVTKMTSALAPYVRIYAPQNEPNGMMPLSYLGAYWPPSTLLATSAYSRTMRECIRQFREAADIIRAARPDALVMSIEALPWWKRNFIGDPLSTVYNTMQRIAWDHLDGIHDTCDLIGFNYYYSQNATFMDFLYRGGGEKGSNYTQMGWVIDPESFYNLIMTVQKRYRKPMVVMENGIGTLNEQKKIKYLRDHINQMRRAMADGADVRGYFAWTLVDNYEWHEGYKANFGLAIMDPDTKTRNLEPSGLYYRNLIERFGNLRADLD